MWPNLDKSLVEAGYAVLGVNIPGTGCSSGALSFFEKQWGTDGAEAVQWAAHQKWSNGNVGMANWSFAGLSQVFVADQAPANLRAIAPGMVVTDPTRDVTYPGGVENTLFPAVWWAFIQEQWSNAATHRDSRRRQTCLANIARHKQEGETSNPTTMAKPTRTSMRSTKKPRHGATPTRSTSRCSRSRTGRTRRPAYRGGFYQSRWTPKDLVPRHERPS